MITCFYCGRSFLKGQQAVRRMVKTGEDRLRPLGLGRVWHVRTTYGKRVICTRCALWLDREEQSRERWGWMALAGMLLTLGAVVWIGTLLP